MSEVDANGAGARRRKRRILLVQPSIQPRGGGHALAAWFLEALWRDYELHLQLFEPPSFEEINAYYGTRLPDDAAVVHLVPRPWRRAVHALRRSAGMRLDLLHLLLTMRAASALEGEMDLVISAHNEIQSERPVLQYVHFPWGYWPRPDAEMRWFHRVPGILPAYYALAQALYPVARERIAQNRTLVNSAWTGRHYHALYGVEPEVLFPPIAGTPPAVPWSARREAFVALGRFDRIKRLERAIAVVDALRLSGREVELSILGSPECPRYLAELGARAASRPWITLRHGLRREEILPALATHRYGIHCMEGEHFGMAVAEMVLAGCIPFVHAEGGPMEIVGDERLSYRSEDEAVRKITRVLDDPELQRDLRHGLSLRAPMFTAARFQHEVRRIVAELVARTGQQSGARRPHDAP